MKMKKFSGFNEKGNLPQGVYNMTLDELEENFSKNKSEKRNEIMSEYKKHLKEIEDTDCCSDHWVNGSFITMKKNPKDIDTFTEFDGLKIDKNNKKEEVKDLIKNSQHRTNYLCHSLRVYKYPHTDKKNFERYINSKRRILIKLFGTDRDGDPKGFIHLIRGDKDVL